MKKDRGFTLDDLTGKKPKGGGSRASRGGGGQGGGGGSGRPVRDAMRTGALAGTPQAIVKITGFGKASAAHVKARLDYYTRYGEVEARDEAGERHHGEGTAKAIVNDWGDAVRPEAKTAKARGRERLSMHLMISSPIGTDRAVFAKIAKDFGETAFPGRRYAYAVHNDTEKPHAHFVVPLRGDDGRKMNPRKADLQRWREQFAEVASKRGVHMVATRSYEHRQEKAPLDRSSTVSYRMMARGEVSERHKKDMRAAMRPAPDKMLEAIERIAKRKGIEVPEAARSNVVAARTFLEAHSAKPGQRVVKESAERHLSQAEKLRAAGKAALAGLHEVAGRMEPVGRVEGLRREIGRVGAGKEAVSPRMAALAASIAQERGLEVPKGDFKAVREFLNKNAEREIPLQEKPVRGGELER